MPGHDPDEVIETAQRQQSTIREHYLPAVEWFLERPGLDRRGEAVDALAAHLDVDREDANLVVGHLVSDEADPVQQVIQPKGGKFVGVIDHAEHEWFYAFDRYDDVEGRQRRGVCAHCVHEERTAAEVTHFTRPPDEYDLDSARRALALHYHVDHAGRALSDVLAEDLGVDPDAFADRHGLSGPDAVSLRDVTRRLDADPALEPVDPAGRLAVPDVDIEPGASLVSGTTIASNTAWHAGNDGPGSGLNADTVDDQQATQVWKLLQQTKEGDAHTFNQTGASTFGTYSASTYVSITFSVSYSFPAVFVSASYPTAKISLGAYRNGKPLTVTPLDDFEYLVQRVTTNESFTLAFHWDTTTKESVFANLFYARVAEPTFTI